MHRPEIARVVRARVIRREQPQLAPPQPANAPGEMWQAPSTAVHRYRPTLRHRRPVHADLVATQRHDIALNGKNELPQRTHIARTGPRAQIAPRPRELRHIAWKANVHDRSPGRRLRRRAIHPERQATRKVEPKPEQPEHPHPEGERDQRREEERALHVPTSLYCGFASNWPQIGRAHV